MTLKEAEMRLAGEEERRKYGSQLYKSVRYTSMEVSL